MVEEDITEVKIIANGIIVVYILFAIAGIAAGAVGVWWGIFAILIMTVLTYGIAPAYSEAFLLYNYALFALLILVSLLTLANVSGMHVVLMLMTIVGPIMVIAVPVGHILYLVRQERKELKPVTKGAARAPLPSKEAAPAEGKPAPQKEVGGKISRGFALFCGYERLKARHAFVLLFIRTAITWVIGSVVILILTKVLKIW